MNKMFFTIFAAMLMSFPLKVDAQGRNRSGENFDKEAFLVERSAFVTMELGLTPEEVEVFVPLCEELQQKKFEIGRKCRKLSREVKSNASPTDADYIQVIDVCLDAGMKEAQLEKEYYERFKKILSPSKLYKYKSVDHKFMQDFMRGVRGKSNK